MGPQREPHTAGATIADTRPMTEMKVARRNVIGAAYQSSAHATMRLFASIGRGME